MNATSPKSGAVWAGMNLCAGRRVASARATADQGRASGELEPWEGRRDARPPTRAGNAAKRCGPPHLLAKRASPTAPRTQIHAGPHGSASDKPTRS